MSRNAIQSTAVHLLEEAAPLEFLVCHAVTLANLENRPEVLDWYIIESLGGRLEALLRQTATLVGQVPASRPDLETIEAHVRGAEQKLKALQEIADEIVEEADREGQAVIEAEDDQALANRAFEAFVFIRNLLDRLAAAPCDSQ